MLHDRMPVILEPADWPVWLGEVEGDPSALLHPAAEGVLRLWPIDKRVGNVRNDGPELLELHVPLSRPRLEPLRQIRCEVFSWGGHSLRLLS